MIRARLSLGLFGVLAGCLDVPSGPPQECVKSADCDTANGEVCAEGTCYGNPPAGMYAVVISPPAARKDLVPRELTMPSIAADGWIQDLALDRPAMLTGRIEAMCTPPTMCDHGAIGATISITRPSSFKGGTGFKIAVDAAASSQSTGPSFDIALPKTGASDQPYLVTIIPAGRTDATATTSPSEQFPPKRLSLNAKENSITQMIQLGGPNLPTIDGTVQSMLGGGLPQYRVVALGRWEANAPATEVSSVAYTGASGAFHLVLSENLVGTVELVATPAPNGPPAPTLHLLDVPGQSSSQRSLVQPASLGNTVHETFAVHGVETSGAIVAVRGARVTVTAAVGSPTTGETFATFSADGTADDSGNVTLDLLDGYTIATSYKLEIVPPASSQMGVVFDQPLDLAHVAPTLLLPSRVAIRGRVVDFGGSALKDVSVTARPSLRFTWSFIDAAPQAFLTAIPAATMLTLETGEFKLYVDPTVDGLWGHYDLAFDPASKARAPSWIEGDIEIPRDSSQTTVSVDEVRLPDAAAIRGMVLDPNGIEVEGAEVKIFRLSSSLALCNEVLNAPASCPIPAVLQGRGDSDAAGIVRLTLPR